MGVRFIEVARPRIGTAIVPSNGEQQTLPGCGLWLPRRQLGVALGGSMQKSHQEESEGGFPIS